MKTVITNWTFKKYYFDEYYGMSLILTTNDIILNGNWYTSDLILSWISTKDFSIFDNWYLEWKMKEKWASKKQISLYLWLIHKYKMDWVI